MNIDHQHQNMGSQPVNHVGNVRLEVHAGDNGHVEGSGRAGTAADCGFNFKIAMGPGTWCIGRLKLWSILITAATADGTAGSEVDAGDIGTFEGSDRGGTGASFGFSFNLALGPEIFCTGRLISMILFPTDADSKMGGFGATAAAAIFGLGKK